MKKKTAFRSSQEHPKVPGSDHTELKDLVGGASNPPHSLPAHDEAIKPETMLVGEATGFQNFLKQAVRIF